jgi:archaemetzincin
MSKLNLEDEQNLRIGKKICIQPIGNKISGSMSEEISFLYQKLKNYFKKVAVLNLTELRTGFNPIRQQFDSNAVLNSVKVVCDINVGILEEDIYSHGFNFVFGTAEIGGRRAVVSIHRLKPEFYGLEKDADLLNLRALKEVMHETGHVLGLSRISKKSPDFSL